MYKIRRKGRRKGVSTVIGMAIFLIIFAMAASYTFIWTQYFADYSSAVKTQIESQQLRSAERLIVEVYNGSSGYWLNVSNPTAQVAVVTQVWSNHSYQTGEWGIPAFGWSRINITPAISNPDGNFKVVTLRGNVFAGTYTPLGGAMEGRWNLIWYNDTGVIGKSYIDNLNINMRWHRMDSPIGFNASTRVKALDSEAFVLVKFPISSNATLKISTGSGEPQELGVGVNQIIIPEDVTQPFDLNIYVWVEGVEMDMAITFIGLDFATD
ncbi:MAG: hypothetical protein ABC595_05815 [Candidatus Methanosuratincola petrocarbonis]